MQARVGGGRSGEDSKSIGRLILSVVAPLVCVLRIANEVYMRGLYEGPSTQGVSYFNEETVLGNAILRRETLLFFFKNSATISFYPVLLEYLLIVLTTGPIVCALNYTC